MTTSHPRKTGKYHNCRYVWDLHSENHYPTTQSLGKVFFMYFICMFLYGHVWFRQIKWHIFGYFSVFLSTKFRLGVIIWRNMIQCNQMSKVELVSCKVEGMPQPIHLQISCFLRHPEKLLSMTRLGVFIVDVFDNNESWEAYNLSRDDLIILFSPFVILVQDSYICYQHDHFNTLLLVWPLRTTSN